MLDELYVLARLRELSRTCAQIAAERKAHAALAASPANDAPLTADACESAPQALASLPAA